MSTSKTLLNLRDSGVFDTQVCVFYHQPRLRCGRGGGGINGFGGGGGGNSPGGGGGTGLGLGPPGPCPPLCGPRCPPCPPFGPLLGIYMPSFHKSIN